MAITELYRHFSASGDLLYVGISLSALIRLRAHNRTSEWANQISRVEIEQFPDRTSALAAERVAIRTEKPLRNVMGAIRKTKTPSFGKRLHNGGCPHAEMETLRRYMDAMSPSEQVEFCARVGDVSLGYLRRAITATNRIGVNLAVRLTTRSRGVFNVRRLFPELDIYDYASHFADPVAYDKFFAPFNKLGT